jgi:23S rRNA (pseudouridine1915-N3)-methyltransferase
MYALRISLVWISPRREKSKLPGLAEGQAIYLERMGRYARVETAAYPTEDALLKAQAAGAGRTHLVLLDSRGKQFTSEQFAARVGQLRDQGTQHVVFAIGPADGWSDAARQRADLLLSLGPMTLPHELARVVLAEQIYRAMTILAGHPYHSGH